MVRRNLFLLVCALFVATLGSSFLSINANAGELTATIGNIVGAVEVKKAGTEQFITAENGMVVSTGDMVKTGDKSSASLTFLPGSVIQLAGSAEIVIEKSQIGAENSAVDARVSILSGRLKAMLRDLPPNSTFEIKTPTAVAAVRGTTYYVGSNGEIYVEDGSVTVTNALTGEQFVVSAGQFVVINEDGTVDGPREPTPSEVDNAVSSFVPLTAEPYTPPERPNIVITPTVIDPYTEPASHF